MKRKFMACLLLAVLCIATLLAPLAYAKYAKLSLVTDSLSVTVSNGEGGGGENIEIADVRVNYYTYDGTGNVLAHSETYASLSTEIKIWDEAPASGEFNGTAYTNRIAAEGGHDFLGWSVTGLSHMSGENAHVGTYAAGSVVPLVRLQSEQGVLYTIQEYLVAEETLSEIHLTINLYDVYDKNTLTIKQHALDLVNDGLGYTLLRVAAWDSLEDLRSVAEGDEGENVLSFIAQYKGGKYVSATESDLSESMEFPPEYQELFSTIGTFSELEFYHLTSKDDSETFYFHPGRVYSSAFPGFNGAVAGAKYKVKNSDNTTTKHDVESYLYTSNDSLEDEYIFYGGIAPDENITLYAADHTPMEDIVIERGDVGISGDGDIVIDAACFTTGTLVTLADGRRIPVEELTDEHLLRVYDHEKGEYTVAPPLLINYDGDKEYTVARLEFADGEALEIINERGLFDLTLNEYVYVTPSNCTQFIGHEFAKEAESGFARVRLVNAYETTKYTGCYSVTSTYYINHFINGYLTVPGGFHWFVNYFEYGENLRYDQEAMTRDIEIYGLYTVEDFAAYVPEDMLFLFDTIYPAKYLKVTVGKGLARFEDILTVIQDWIIHYDLSGKLEQIQPK